MLELVDSHCHIHWGDYALGSNDALKNAQRSNVLNIVCIGTTADDSRQAIALAEANNGVWASVGLHPHDAKKKAADLESLEDLLKSPKVIAIGECGLDYFYEYSPKADQKKALKIQIELALKHDLPIVFHVREAFDDLWPIFDEYKGVKGIFHSFSAGPKELDQILRRGLYVGLNGIITFSKNPDQIEAAKQVPLNKILIETDAPFLTPVPLRGEVNQPSNVVHIADFLSRLRGESLELLAAQTTNNFKQLFLAGRG